MFNFLRPITLRYINGGGMAECCNVDAANNFPKYFFACLQCLAPQTALQKRFWKIVGNVRMTKRYDNGELGMLTYLWEYRVIYEQSSSNGQMPF